jgi:hypothetical protein
MRKQIKDVLDSLLSRIGSRDIPALETVPTFPSAAKNDWKMPEGDLVMLSKTQPDRYAFGPEARFEQVIEVAEAAILRLPLIGRAAEWGITVKAVPGNDKFYGCYCLSEPRQILLASPEPIIFFHEVAHAAHEKILGHLVPWQSPRQEIVAGLCAQLISEIMEGGDYRFLGNTYRLIARHSFTMKVSPLAGCWQVLPEIHHATRLILAVDDLNNL